MYSHFLISGSQAEDRKPLLQHHIGIDTRNPDFFLIANNKGTYQPAHHTVEQRLYHMLSEQ